MANVDLSRNLITLDRVSEGCYSAALGSKATLKMRYAEAVTVPRVLMEMAFQTHEVWWDWDESVRTVSDPWPQVAGPSILVFRSGLLFREDTPDWPWDARLIDSRGIWEFSYGRSPWRALANLALLLVDRNTAISFPNGTESDGPKDRRIASSASVSGLAPESA